MSNRARRRPVIEEIEPRILYSADFSPTLLDAEPAIEVAEQRTVDASGEYSYLQAHGSQAPGREIVFVDTAVPEYDQIVQDIRTQTGRAVDIVVLDGGADGIAQISAVLAQQHDINAVHIVSHGRSGAVTLGTATLDFDRLLASAAQIKGWGEALSRDADVLIYGCNVAQTTEGKSLIDALSRLTGADVAASDDLTGAVRQSADWVLEYSSGYVDTQVAVSGHGRAFWSGTLATYTVTSTADSGAGSLRTAITNANSNAGADTINFAIAGAGVHTISLASILPAISEAILLDGWSQPGYTLD
jgi:hypothetical protein